MRRALTAALILSLLLHLGLGLVIRLWPIPEPPESARIEVEIVPAPERMPRKPPKQIVREALVPEQLKVNETEDPLRFWSNQTQSVRKQTRAAQLGMTENRFDSAQRGPKRPAPQKNGSEKERPKTLDRDALIQAAREVSGGTGLPVLGNPGISTVGENLPEDVQIGSFTALNTDRYLYYSFYSRVEELIRYRWENGVQQAMDVVPRERLAANLRNRWITHMEILLNPQGEFLRVLVLKPSGIPAFDQAAARAFAEARLFPNPPAEMVEEDGMIHLKYSFTVYYDPTLVARP